MKRILFAAAAMIAFGSAAFAEGPAGQTFDVVSGEDHSTVTFTADGTFTHTHGDTVSEGAYTYADGELCLTASDEGAEAMCGAWTDLEIGESTTTTEFSEDGAELVITRVS